jgi:hypothetical protein
MAAKETKTTLPSPEKASCNPIPANPKGKRISRKELSVLKEGLKINPQEREVLVGLLLRDGSLQTQDKGRTYRFVYSQGGKSHEAYFNHVYAIFKDRGWVIGPPQTILPRPAHTSTGPDLGENTLTGGGGVACNL